jgi:hypothetical protein
MDRIWQWTWDRYRNSYSWAAWAVATLVSVPVYLFWSSLVIAVEGSSADIQAPLVSVVVVPAVGYMNISPAGGRVAPWIIGVRAKDRSSDSVGRHLRLGPWGRGQNGRRQRCFLLTQQTVDALSTRPPALIDRGSHAVKGKSAAVQIYGLDAGRH